MALPGSCAGPGSWRWHADSGRAGTDTAAFRATLGLLLPGETELLILLMAAGATFMGLVAAESPGIASPPASAAAPSKDPWT